MSLLRQILFCVVWLCVCQCVLGSSVAKSKLISRLRSNLNVKLGKNQPSELNLVRNYLNSLQKSNIYNKRTKTDTQPETEIINHNHLLSSVVETRAMSGVPETVLVAPQQEQPVRTRGSRTPSTAAGIHIANSHRPTHPPLTTTAKTHVTDAQVDLAERQGLPDAQVDLAERQGLLDAQVDMAERQGLPDAQVELTGRQGLTDAKVDLVRQQGLPDAKVDLVRRQELESHATVLPDPWSHGVAMGGEGESLRGTAPPLVCDLCPTTVDNKNPLSPCTCVGNSGSLAGEISITCPASTATTEQLHDLFTHTDFLTTKVFRFTLQGSNVTGVLSQDLWGDLAFTQVLIIANKITHVDNKAFNNSANTLTLLNLDNNQISYYVTSGVDDLPMLTTLVLKRNRIPIIFTNAFNYSSLRVLDLSSNLIDSIGKNAFSALDKLEELYLQRNLLTRIDDDCFRFYSHNPNSDFLTIDLSYNKISYISEYAFRGLRNVQINLWSNLLTTIPEKVFRPIIIDSLYFVYFTFDGNNIDCDCKIMWIVEDPSVLSCFDNFMCVNMDAPVYSLDPKDLGNCTNNAHH